MAGDIDVVFTSDDAGVRTGMARLEQLAGKTAKKVEGGFGQAWGKAKKEALGFENAGKAAAMGVTAAVALAGKAVADYAKQNDMVAASFERLQASGQKTWTAIGRDISAGLIGSLDTAIEKVETLRQGIVDKLANLMGGDSEGVGSAMKTTETMIKEKERNEKIRREQLRQRQADAEASGDGVGAAKARAELFRMDEKSRIGKLGLSGGADKDALIAGVDRQAAAMVKKAQREAAEAEQKSIDEGMAIAAKGDAEDRAAREKEARDRQQEARASVRLGWMIREEEITNRRLAGEDELADRLERQLELSKALASVAEDESLSAQQKAAASGRLEELMGERALLLDKAKPATTSVRTLEAGIASQSVIAQVFGGGGQTTAQTQVSLAKKQVEVLTKIADNTKGIGTGVAVYAE